MFWTVICLIVFVGAAILAMDAKVGWQAFTGYTLMILFAVALTVSLLTPVIRRLKISKRR